MVKCPHCQQKWVSTLGCVNPDCDFKVKYSFAKGTSDEEKQSVINGGYKKWLEDKGVSQTPSEVKDSNALLEPIIHDPVSPIPQHPEEREQEALYKNDTGLELKEKSETPYIPAVDDNKYKLNWGSKTPGHIVYLIDLSGTMGLNDGRNIKDVLEVVYNCLSSFVGKCSVVNPKTGEVKLVPRLTATIIGYNSKIVRLFPRSEKEKGGIERIDELIDIDPEKDYIFDIKEGGLAYPQWQTKTAEAFAAAREDVERWMKQQKENGIPMPAPYVIHITDGHPEETDAETKKEIPEDVLMDKALEEAKKLKDIETEDGHLLLFNIHYNTNGSNTGEELVTPVKRPSGNTQFDKRRQFLYDASSVLPTKIVESIQTLYREDTMHVLKKNVQIGSRAMISNSQDKELLSDFVVFSSQTGFGK